MHLEVEMQLAVQMRVYHRERWWASEGRCGEGEEEMQQKW